MTRIKDWSKFQHFKDRRPPWIKLYRDILDDIEWHELDSHAAKVLVMLWLIASENDGNLPDIKKLAFRLRTTESKTSELLSKLSHWVEQDDISAISPQHQSDAPETEGETETEEEKKPRKRASPVDVEKPEDVTDQTWADWMQLRKTKRAPVTGTVLDGAKSEAAKAGMPLQRFLEIWCMRGSQGLEADWLRGNERGKPADAVHTTVPTNPAAIYKPEPSFTPEQLAANRERMRKEMAKLKGTTLQ